MAQPQHRTRCLVCFTPDTAPPPPRAHHQVQCTARTRRSATRHDTTTQHNVASLACGARLAPAQWWPTRACFSPSHTMSRVALRAPGAGPVQGALHRQDHHQQRRRLRPLPGGGQPAAMWTTEVGLCSRRSCKRPHLAGLVHVARRPQARSGRIPALRLCAAPSTERAAGRGRRAARAMMCRSVRQSLAPAELRERIRRRRASQRVA